MKSTLIFSIVLVTFSLTYAQLNVTLPNGPIVGHELKTFTDKRYYGFQGIPYAKPPLGELRFQAPEPPDNWTEILNATKDSNYCYQLTADSPKEDEDCLYINVFSPVLDASTSETKVPVIFWIYGGGFRAGAATFAGNRPEYFMDEDVILVTHNYRVGPFGFLSTGDTVIPGNAGLKDQLLALKWTNENIHLFGGDPEKITIYGQSAGSASVGYQILSNQSAGLYRAAIAESGSPLNMWTYLDTAKDYAVDLAQVLMNETISAENAKSEYLKDFLQGVAAKEIDTASTKTKIYQPAITIEPEHEDAFITEAMFESFASGNFNKVPILMGINSEERIAIIKDSASLRKEGATYDSHPELLVPTFFNTETDKKTIGESIKQVYVGNETFGAHLGRVVRYESDNRFTRGVIKQGKLLAPHTPVYFYQFSYDGVLGSFNKTIDDAERVGHAEELRYIFTSNPLSKLDEGDALTHKRLIKMWMNFVKNLNPTTSEDTTLGLPIWPQVTEDSYKYLNINVTVTVESDPKGDYFKGWETVFDKYSPRPYVTF